MFGLPTGGPFGLKLEMALRIAGVPYERVFEDDHRKGPKRKSPWIEQGGVRMGDTSMILQYLGVDLDARLTPRQRAESHALRRMVEEHWHQILEYELFLHPVGFDVLDAQLQQAVPRPIAPLLGRFLRRMFRKHLFERGIARHTQAEVEALGRADLDAVDAWLEGREWTVADHPTTVDCSLFGLLAVPVRSPSPTPCYTYARSLPNIVRFVDQVQQRFFSDTDEARIAA